MSLSVHPCDEMTHVFATQWSELLRVRAALFHTIRKRQRGFENGMRAKNQKQEIGPSVEAKPTTDLCVTIADQLWIKQVLQVDSTRRGTSWDIGDALNFLW
ncbi:hypothetical protein Q8A67_025008 [Cirrhinus molitorella]|uniref:Uncharacterized protein n=1 Tax=Cirrhinus molitorella TaxID=172907 RepID=A0AA88T6W7_9TELE|nr:hypothetical protein Q8A67_025008 [Cirrhinus molitorella]